jgi:hypothetical protein
MSKTVLAKPVSHKHRLKTSTIKDAEILWLSRTSNRKTGDVPTAFIGKTVHQALRTCKGCNLLKQKDCYAWFGTVVWGFKHIIKAYKQSPHKYTFLYALANRAPTAKMIRIGAIGDPSRARKKDLLSAYKLAKQLGLAFVGYTHFHRDAEAWRLRKLLMASCDSITEADEAVARGWRATAIVPYDFEGKRFVTPAGNHAVICPAQSMPDKFTCNDCLLCDADKKTKFKIVAFKDHGPKVRNKVRSLKKLPMVGE